MSGERISRDPFDSEGRRQFARRIKTANTIVELLGIRGQAGELDAEWYDRESTNILRLKRRIDPRAHEQARYLYALQYAPVTEVSEGYEESVILFYERTVAMQAIKGPVAYECENLDIGTAQEKMWELVDGFFDRAPIPAIDSLPENTNDA